MVEAFAVVFACIIVVHGAGFLRFWRESGESLAALFQRDALLKALRDALGLNNLDSNGVGCTYPDERHSRPRRRVHHFTFYGVLPCTLPPTVAARYHSLCGRDAPHPSCSVRLVP